MLIIISFGSRSRGRFAGVLCALSLLGFGLAGIAAIVCFRCATAGTRPHSSVSTTSSSLFFSLPLCASGTRLLERDLVLVNTPLGPPTPVHTQLEDSSRYFLRWIGAWPSPAVTISVFVGRRPAARRIKSSVLIEIVWFGRIASGIHLRISLQMAYGLRENFVGAGWRIP